MNRFHYAWVICAGTALLMLCNMGFAYNLFTYYFPFLVAEGISHSQISDLFAIRSMFALVGTFFVRQFVKKFRLRLGSALSVLCLTASSLLFAFGRTYSAYAAAALFAGLSYCFGTTIMTSYLIKNWFQKRRGLALGLASASSGIVPIVFPSVVNHFVAHFGLHETFLIEAGFTCVLAGIVYIIVRDTPEELGMTPYGTDVESVKNRKEEVAYGGYHDKGTEALLVAAMFLIGCSGAVFCGHMSVVITSSGYSADVAALAFSVYGVLLLISKFVFGHCADSWGTLPASLVFGFPVIVSYFLPLFMDGVSELPCYIMMALFGIGSSMMVVGPTLWAYDFSTARQYEAAMQRYMIFFEIGGVIASAIPGRIYDLTGEYASSFFGGGVLILISVGLLILSYHRRSVAQRNLPQSKGMNPCKDRGRP